MDDFNLLFDTPGHAAAVIDGELHELDWSEFSDVELLVIAAELAAEGAARQRRDPAPFDASVMVPGPVS